MEIIFVLRCPKVHTRAQDQTAFAYASSNAAVKLDGGFTMDFDPIKSINSETTLLIAAPIDF